MISIGAQSRTPSDIVNATGFQRWNEGLIDVITPEKLSEVVAEKTEESKDDPNKVMAESYSKLLSTDGVITKYYTLGQSPTKDIIDSQLSTAASVFNFVVSNYAVTEDKPTQTFIPFDLGLDLLMNKKKVRADFTEINKLSPTASHTNNNNERKIR